MQTPSGYGDEELAMLLRKPLHSPELQEAELLRAAEMWGSSETLTTHVLERATTVSTPVYFMGRSAR
jgi:hypothetical protein